MQNLSTSDGYLTGTELSSLIRVREQTLAVWRMSGKGPRYTRIGHGSRGRVLYKRSDVEDWLASRTWDSTAAETVSTSKP